MVKDGYKFAAVPLVIGALAAAFHWYWLCGIFVLLGLFVMFFFRDPQRTPPADPNTIVSPADGRVMLVLEEQMGGKPDQRVSLHF